MFLNPRWCFPFSFDSILHGHGTTCWSSPGSTPCPGDYWRAKHSSLEPEGLQQGRFKLSNSQSCGSLTFHAQDCHHLAGKKKLLLCKPGSCLRGLLGYKGKNMSQRTSNNLGQFSNVGKRQKSEGSKAFTQATEEIEKKTTQHSPCSYVSGIAVPRIAYSETRKLREQQGRAESWPFGKKRNNPQQTNPRGKEKKHGTAAVLGLGDMNKSIQNILVNLYFQKLCKQMVLP